MIKIIIFLVGLVCVNMQGMLTPETALAYGGAICSVGSYYFLAQAIDSYNHEADVKKCCKLLKLSAGLKLSSIVFLAPKLSQKKYGGVLFGIEELGALYTGVGLYLLKSAHNKHICHYLPDQARQDLCMGSILMTLGAFTLYFTHTRED